MTSRHVLKPGVLLTAGLIAAACSDGTGPDHPVAPLKFIAITVGGGGSTCGIAADSALYCWGPAGLGQLGTPTSETCEYGDGGSAACRARPLRVAGAPKLTSIASGYAYHCGTDPTGVPYCWGTIFVEMDIGYDLGQAPTPLPGALSFAEIVGGGAHICGRTSGGAAYCWGEFLWGARGDGTVTLDTFPRYSFTPNPVHGGHSFARVVANTFGTCGLTIAGPVYCWGPDYMGGLGDPAAPTQACIGFRLCMPVPNPVAGGLVFTSLSAGSSHFCGLEATGAVYCWGEGTRGQLGNSPVQICSSPPNSVQTCAPAPEVAYSAGQFVAVAAGGASTCGLDIAGAAICWGSNDYGQLGTGGGPYGGTVLGGHAFRVIVPGPRHSCGLTVDSLAYCWGDNDFGSLGSGTTTDSNEPVAVVGPAPP